MKKIKPKKKKNCKVIRAKYNDYKEFVLDPLGYLLLRVNYEKKELEVGLCKKDNVIEVLVVGKKPLEVYKTVLDHHLISRKDHAAYLGRELQKAYVCLKKRVLYVQDSEIDFNKKVDNNRKYS